MISNDELERRQKLWSHGYWEIPENIDVTGFDFNWRPFQYDRPYVHQFGTQWQRTGGPRFVIPESEGVKYCDNQRAIALPCPDRFEKLTKDNIEFDYSWHPDDTEPPFIWVFGNKWIPVEIDPAIQYIVPGASQKKYVTDIVAILPQSTERWIINNQDDLKSFDFSWRPHPYDPPQTYVWWENNGPIYDMKDAIGTVFMNRDPSNELPISRYYIETTLDELIGQHPTEVFWALNREIKYDNFDFTWRPTRDIHLHINAFGNEFSKDVGTYYVNAVAWHDGHKEINYVEEVCVEIETNIDVYYIVVDSGQNQYDELKKRIPNLQKTRFMNSWVDTISRCARKATSKFMWILSSEFDYSDFEFDYYPSVWNQNFVNVFGTQWSHWGNTYLINTKTFDRDTEYVRKIEYLKNINHVRNRPVRAYKCLHDIVYIDFGNTTDTLDMIQRRYPDKNIQVLPYENSYYNTLKSWVTGLEDYHIRKEHFIWVCTSVTDYTNFDFSWLPDPFQQDQLHVFATTSCQANQKFGDTFLINLNIFKDECKLLKQLEKYANKINYVAGPNHTVRLAHPVIEHECDTQVDALRLIADAPSYPYYEMISLNACDEIGSTIPTLWNSENSPVIVTNKGASRIFMPAGAPEHIHTEIYDYQYIDSVPDLYNSKPLDIVFFSNGEPNADENYQRLLDIVQQRGLPNRVVRSDRVVGRVASQHAAANLSTTDWYFLVNAKLKVNLDFDFSWQPDRLQQAKHYIFMAQNPVNTLVYGHQAIVANNKRLTLSTVATGLDFTMDSHHEVVDVLSGVAIYNTDPWTTWRTAFRESIKLAYYSDIVDGGENNERLDTWLRVGIGENGQWSTAGARDAVEYYESVDGELTELKRSYDWAWLEELYQSKYGR